MGRDTPAAPENRPQLYPLHYETVIRRALSEDLGEAGDRTTDSIIPAAATAHAVLRARAPGRVAGLEAALYAFRLLDPDLAATVHATDGSDVEAGETIATLAGRARAILTGERTALNLLSRLC
ncbi:MAG: nicotinate-nucleotide diphosphorylase (carboxylating), partial [Alphaproteobacteria bacterium]